ncbi:hypothetical protein B566_EDAN007097, partial [Ephemera danica]
MLDPINFPAFDELRQKYGVTKQICGKKYFISNKRYTGQSIAKMCCDIGMWSVSIETLQEQNCITSFFKNNNPPYIFWTSAFRSGTQPGAFRWCGNVNREISNYEKLRWFPGEPNNKDGSESCIALSATPTKENLFDLNCDTTLNMICEVCNLSRTTLYMDFDCEFCSRTLYQEFPCILFRSIARKLIHIASRLRTFGLMQVI